MSKEETKAMHQAVSDMSRAGAMVAVLWTMIL